MKLSGHLPDGQHHAHQASHCTWDTAARRDALYGTFHGYQGLTPNGDRIDWILATPGVRVHRASVNTFSVRGQFPGDHLPVQASLGPGRSEAP